MSREPESISNNFNSTSDRAAGGMTKLWRSINDSRDDVVLVELKWACSIVVLTSPSIYLLCQRSL